MKRILFTVLLGLAAVIAVWFGFNPLIDKMAPKTSTTPIIPLASGTVINPSKPMTDFALTATDGKNFTQYSLLGHWTLMFFGYAECPAICPTTLSTVAQVWKSLPDYMQDKNTFSFVFVSLDPKTDTTQNLRNFLGKFNPNFMGLTGDEAVVQKLSKFCSVYSWQDPNAKTEGPKVIDHSATLILVNPKGQIQAIFSPPHQVEALSKDLQLLIH